MRHNFTTTEGSVLHVLDHSWPVLSGYSVRSRNLISSQHRLGESVVVLTGPLQQLDDPDAADTIIDDVSYSRTPIEGITAALVQRRWPFIREYEIVRVLRAQILRTIARQDVAIVHAHSPALCGLAALQAAKRSRLPFVYEVRAFWEDAAVDQNRTRPTSIRYLLTRGLENYVARNADAVVAIARPMIDELRNRGIPSRKLFHIPNAVDSARFAPLERDEELARELTLTGDSPVLGFIGSLYRYEGISWMIGNLAALHAQGLRFQVLIVGRGEDQANVIKAIRDSNASGYAHLIDHVPHENIARYYSIVDILVYPRRSVRLTELVTPLKPLEAMALNKPVLASGVGGIRELVEHERTGLLFQPEDRADFRKQATRLIVSAALRKALGQGGREFVVKERDWKVVGRKYQQLYDTVLPSRHGKERALYGMV